MSNLTNLIIGKIPSDEPMKSLLETLQQNILEIENVLVSMVNSNCEQNHIILFGSYSCRLLLESAFTALIARVDPLRILFLHAHQSSREYEVSSRNKSAVQWTGDVIPKDKNQEKLWAVDPEKTVWRALFGEWQNQLIIKPSFEALVDFQSTSSQWLQELKSIEPKGIGEFIRGNADRLYSELSKAVHAEFVIPRANVIDVTTVREYVVRTFQLIAHVSLLSHFSSVQHGRLPIGEALEFYTNAEETINGSTN